MKSSRAWARFLSFCTLTLSVTSGLGCVSLGQYLHPSGDPAPEQIQPCLAVDKCYRDRVHVFFLNGVDPLNQDNLPGLQHYVAGLGFEHTYYGQLYDYWQIKNDICAIHQRDPLARFVLVGFSFGANEACAMTKSLKADDIPIDLLVFIGGDTLTREDRPRNADQVINVTGPGHPLLFFGLVWDGAEIWGAENLRVTETDHAGLPTYRQTQVLLARELATVAANARLPRQTVSRSAGPAGGRLPVLVELKGADPRQQLASLNK